MTTTTSTLPHYLDLLRGSREVGLAVTKDDTQLKRLQKELDSGAFQLADSAEDLAHGSGDGIAQYIVITQENAKKLYDFAAQYPTGQVQLFDPASMQTTSVAPQYAQASILLLVSQRTLKSLEKQGFYYRKAAGLTYRS